jgi:hypothetical protein
VLPEGDACGSDVEERRQGVATVVVIIRASRSVQLIREKLEHQIEPLHRVFDLRYKHSSDRSRFGLTREAHNKSRQPASLTNCSRIGSIKIASLFLTLPTRALTGQHVILPEG